MGNAESLAAEAEAAKAKRQSNAFERASAQLSATRKQKLSRHIIDLVEIYADLLRRDRNYAYEAVKAYIESHQEDINYCDEVIY
jgi:putative NADPH-quinone reductase